MILVASQRGGGQALANHLLNDVDNDHVDIEAVEGFMGDTVHEAFKEIEALSKGTHCKQYLFSVSLSAPKDANASTEIYLDAIERVADKNGLANQPKVIVFHEKEGRRHCHAVFSRIDVENMKAINLPFYKDKLAAMSKQLYIDHDWTLPKGHIDKNLRNPLNFTRAEWEQAKRVKNHPHVIKSALQRCWHKSHDRKSFENKLQQHGYQLAKGDKRGYVVVDTLNNVYSLSRWIKQKSKDLQAKLGHRDELPSVETVQNNLDQQLQAQIKQRSDEINQRYEQRKTHLKNQYQHLQTRHDTARNQLKQAQHRREQQENLARINRHAKGLKGLINRISGQYHKIEQRNDHERLTCLHRDRSERDKLIFSQLQEKATVQNSFDRIESDRLQAQQDFKAQVTDTLNRTPDIDNLPSNDNAQPQQSFDMGMD